MSELPDTVHQQPADWRPRSTAEGPPLQPLGRSPRTGQSDVFNKAVAQALQEAMESTPVEVPSILRDNSGRNALFNVVMRFVIAVAIAAGVATVLVLAIPASQRPAAQSSDTGSISAAWQSVKSSLFPAPQQKSVPTLFARESSGLPNDLLPLGIHVGSTPPGAVLAIYGLPAGAKLTSGKRISASEWRVPAPEVSAVSVIPPSGFAGQMVVSAELRDGDGAALAAGATRLSWSVAASPALQPPPPAVAAVPPAVAPPAAVAVAPPAAMAVAPPAPAAVAVPAAPPAPVAVSPPPPADIVRSLDTREIAGLVKRGQELLAGGDIQSARLLLQRGAEARHARSALLLGTTYDPSLLRQQGAGELADVSQARSWYQKAKEWGEPDAQRRLEALARSR